LDGSAKAPADIGQENPEGTLELSGPLAFRVIELGSPDPTPFASGMPAEFGAEIVNAGTLLP
jgi:hypothetical protein